MGSLVEHVVARRAIGNAVRAVGGGPSILAGTKNVRQRWYRREEVNSLSLVAVRGPTRPSLGLGKDPRRTRAGLLLCTAALVIPERSVSVILLAGGKGKRMGANMPKQYLPLMGQPIALHSFHTFSTMPEVVEIIVVCDPSYRDIFEEQNVSIPLKFALPGKERQDSVLSGLQEISQSSKLACIHDSARPLVLPEDILKVVKDAWTNGAAVLGVPVKATIKEAGKDRLVIKTLDRRILWEMQTPQVIEPQLLLKGFELVEREGYEVTDDVSIVEYLKHPVLITEGSYTNIKITTPDDLVVAERILHQSTPTAMAAFLTPPVVEIAV